MINLTVRSRKDIVNELDRIAALKHLDRAQLLRIILEKHLMKLCILLSEEVSSSELLILNYLTLSINMKKTFINDEIVAIRN